MSLRPLLRPFVLAATLLLLNGCLLVENFGAAWDEAKPDFCLEKISQSLYFASFNRDPAEFKTDDIARGWTLDGQNFLLLKETPSDKGGRLYRFRVINGIFERFRLSPTQRPAFEIEYANAPVSLKHDTVSLKTLGDAEKKLLSEIAKRPEYWESEDKTLYNPASNPRCRFEDRDLKKLEEDRKKKNG